MHFEHSDQVIGHDCLPGRRDGIYVNAPGEQPVGTEETCGMCGTRWTYMGGGQWDFTVPYRKEQPAAPTIAGASTV